MTMNTGVTDVTGKLHQTIYFDKGAIVVASKTYDKDNFGGKFLVATDALVQTLPAAGVETAPFGSRLTFVNSGADGNNLITIAPNAADAIFGTIANAAADSVSGGAVDKDFVNTKATANKGDWITLESDGSTGWFIVGGVGIWASEA